MLRGALSEGEGRKLGEGGSKVKREKWEDSHANVVTISETFLTGPRVAFEA